MFWPSARSSAGLVFKHYFIGEGADALLEGVALYGPANHILEAMEHVPLLVSLLPTLMMVGGFFVALYIYILAPGTAQKWAERNPVLYRFLLNKWYFDELYDLHLRAPGLLARPAVLEGRRSEHHRSASARTASPRASSTSPIASCGCRAAISIIMPSPC